MSFNIDKNVSFHFSMEKRKYPYGSFTFQISQVENGSLVASIIQDKNPYRSDDVGALYYVVAVIFIYGCSILMMIASYIRKNNNDRKLNRYIKEMAGVRKRETQMQLLSATAKAANLSAKRPTVVEVKEKPSKSPRLSSVSEVSNDELFLSDSEWERKHNYHLLTPSPSPGRSPGNSPVSMKNVHVFSDCRAQVAKKYMKKCNPSVVRWVCETETETDGELCASENEQRLNKSSPYSSASSSLQRKKKEHNLISFSGSQASMASVQQGAPKVDGMGKCIKPAGQSTAGLCGALTINGAKDSIEPDSQKDTIRPSDVQMLLENKTVKVSEV